MPKKREAVRQWPAVLKIDVHLCPRCASEHRGMEYHKFDLGDRQFTHWAYCPTTGEPLLLDMSCKGRIRKEPDKFLVRFAGTGKVARGRPNPAYPDGFDVREGVSEGDPCCVAKLPYPAAEIGVWKVSCTSCQSSAACTATGRRDDPRSITLRCQKNAGV